MNTSIQLKGLLAGVAAMAVFGVAIAQGTPPNTAVTNPAIGAGQQSSQGTSMGTTGVPAANAPVDRPAVAAMPAATRSTAMGASGAADATTTASASPRRAMRADRN